MWLFCANLEIFNSRVPEDTLVSIWELNHHIATLEADRRQETAEIESLLETSTQQAATIAALQTKVDQKELSLSAALPQYNGYPE